MFGADSLSAVKDAQSKHPTPRPKYIYRLSLMLSVYSFDATCLMKDLTQEDRLVPALLQKNLVKSSCLVTLLSDILDPNIPGPLDAFRRRESAILVSTRDLMPALIQFRCTTP